MQANQVGPTCQKCCVANEAATPGAPRNHAATPTPIDRWALHILARKSRGICGAHFGDSGCDAPYLCTTYPSHPPADSLHSTGKNSVRLLCPGCSLPWAVAATARRRPHDSCAFFMNPSGPVPLPPKTGRGCVNALQRSHERPQLHPIPYDTTQLACSKESLRCHARRAPAPRVKALRIPPNPPGAWGARRLPSHAQPPMRGALPKQSPG